MRDAALSLAVTQPFASPLINPRQSAPVAYPNSPLNALQARSQPFIGGVFPGAPFINLPGSLAVGGHKHLLDVLGRDFALLLFIADSNGVDLCRAVAASVANSRIPCKVVLISAAGLKLDARADLPDATAMIDTEHCLFAQYAAAHATGYLLRPDNHVAARWRDLSDEGARAEIRGALAHAASAVNKE